MNRRARTIGWLWVVVQGGLLLGLAIAPAVPPAHAPIVWGWLAVACGAVLALFAWRALGDALTPNPVPHKRSSLRMHGVYRYLRHPMYAAVLCAAFGYACARGGWWHWGFFAALLVFFVAKIRFEEAWLCVRYPDYADYRAHTGMLWPRLRNRDR